MAQYLSRLIYSIPQQYFPKAMKTYQHVQVNKLQSLTTLSKVVLSLHSIRYTFIYIMYLFLSSLGSLKQQTS